MRPFLALPKTLAILAVVALAAACGDDVTDPQAIADSAEAEAVLRSAAALPALPAVIERVRMPDDARSRAALFRAAELWASGVAEDGDGAAARRRLAVRYAAPTLVEHLDPAGWDQVEQGLRDWSATARAMLRHVALPGVDARLESAGRHLDRAAAAPDLRSRSQELLLAGSDLVETTPRFVARSLTARAEVAVRDADAARIAADDLARAERLKDWALQAVEGGEYLMAIQRAYYALQLVEAR